MRRVLAAGLLSLVLAACGGSSSKQSRTIVLDRSIGPVSLREPIQDIQHTLGKGVTIHNDQHYGHYVRYRKAGLDVAYAPGPSGEVAFAILTTSPGYRTRRGVGVGSAESEVVKIAGTRCSSRRGCQHGAAYRKPGTAFSLRNGKVWRIAIAVDFD
jgi:hypothetical protein